MADLSTRTVATGTYPATVQAHPYGCMVPLDVSALTPPFLDEGLVTQDFAVFVRGICIGYVCRQGYSADLWMEQALVCSYEEAPTWERAGTDLLTIWLSHPGYALRRA